MKIYTVEENDFYNFIVAVFSSKERAEEWIKENGPYKISLLEDYNRYKMGAVLELDPE